MIEFERINDRIFTITDDWCDKNTKSKIKKIMSRLLLSDRDIMDWEILVDDTIYPTEEEKEISNKYGDWYVERNRSISTTCTEENGDISQMTWEETLDLELREGEGHIYLSILFVRM